MNVLLRLLTAIFAAICLICACSPFGPNDFDECQAQAAKDAKSKEALGILVGKCNQDFPARKGVNGKYTFFDTVTSQFFEVVGPKLNRDEIAKIDAHHNKYWADQEIAKRRADEYQQQQFKKGAEAVAGLKVIKASATCGLSYYCIEKIITATVENNSKYTVQRIGVGWVIAAEKMHCEAALGRSGQSYVRILPGQKALLSWKTYDGPQSIGTLCIEVVDADIE